MEVQPLTTIVNREDDDADYNQIQVLDPTVIPLLFCTAINKPGKDMLMIAFDGRILYIITEKKYILKRIRVYDQYPELIIKVDNISTYWQYQCIICGNDVFFNLGASIFKIGVKGFSLVSTIPDYQDRYGGISHIGRLFSLNDELYANNFTILYKLVHDVLVPITDQIHIEHMSEPYFYTFCDNVIVWNRFEAIYQLQRDLNFKQLMQTSRSGSNQSVAQAGLAIFHLYGGDVVYCVDMMKNVIKTLKNRNDLTRDSVKPLLELTPSGVSINSNTLRSLLGDDFVEKRDTYFSNWFGNRTLSFERDFESMVMFHPCRLPLTIHRYAEVQTTLLLKTKLLSLTSLSFQLRIEMLKQHAFTLFASICNAMEVKQY